MAPVNWETALDDIARFIEETGGEDVAVTVKATVPFINRLVHTFLVENRQYLIDTAVGLDRSYLAPFMGKVLDDSNVVDLLTAVAEAFIDKGLEQTS